MRKIARRSVALLLMFSLLVNLLPVFAAAESGEPALPLTKLYLSGEKLLTELNNMTVSGEVDLFLDGVFFKHAEGICAQQDFRSYQEIRLKSPRADGSVRENGYAVLDLEGSGYAVERYPGHTRISQVTNMSKNRLLRNSVSTQAVLFLGRQAAEILDRQLHVDALEKGEELCIEFSWAEKDIPSLLNGVLNLFWQEAVTRYFEIEFTDMPLEGYASIQDYGTVTEGILYCTRSLSLRSLSVSAALDREGRLKRLEGSASAGLDGRSGDTHVLDASFSLTVDKYGATSLPEDIPAENRYDLLSWNTLPASQIDAFFDTLAASGSSWEEYGLPVLPWPQEGLSHRSILNLEDAVSYAAEVASLDLLGFENHGELVWSASLADDGVYEALGASPADPDHPLLAVSFSSSGEILRLENLGVDFAAAKPVKEEDSDPIIRWRGEIALMLWLFEEKLNPGFTRISDEMLRNLHQYGNSYSAYENTLRSGDGTFYVGYGTSYQNPVRKIKYIVQTSPVVRVVLRDSTIDPLEGGNG